MRVSDKVWSGPCSGIWHEPDFVGDPGLRQVRGLCLVGSGPCSGIWHLFCRFACNKILGNAEHSVCVSCLALDRRSRPGSLQASTVRQCLNGRAPPYLSEHCIPVSSADTRRHLRSAVTYLPYRVSRSTHTVVGHFQLLARWPGTHSRILSGIQWTAQTVLGVYLKRRPTCSRVTSAFSALGGS